MCRPRWITAWMCAVLGAACHSDAPTAPAAGGVDAPSTELTGRVPWAGSTHLAVAVADVRDRVLPTLGDAAVVRREGRGLSALVAALDDASPTRIEAALRSARAGMEQLARRSSPAPEDGPELAVIRLVLDQVGAMAGPRDSGRVR